jgi:transcriptional regulator with XRE-family HTH domain
LRTKDILARFGETIRQKRKKLGVSQEEFADMCGLDRTYVGGIERGERNVSLRNIQKIAKGLRVSLSELFKDV